MAGSLYIHIFKEKWEIFFFSIQLLVFSTLGARGFFLVGGDRVKTRKRQALLALKLLAAGEREDLGHPG